MYTSLDWPWGRALAASRVGQVIQVEYVLFDTVRDRLAEMGIRVGSVLECLESEPLSVRVRLPNGGETQVSRAFAWFVSTRPIAERRSSWKIETRRDRDTARVSAASRVVEDGRMGAA